MRRINGSSRIFEHPQVYPFDYGAPVRLIGHHLSRHQGDKSSRRRATG
jgi:hypothetical protein